MTRRFFSFFIVGITASGMFLCASAFVPETFVTEMLLAGLAVYVTGMFLDARSTCSFGRKTVGVMEVSPVFRVTSRRFGFRAATAVQVALELFLGMLLLPLAVNFEASLVTAYFCLFLFGAIHMTGYAKNRVTGKRDQTAKKEYDVLPQLGKRVELVEIINEKDSIKIIQKGWIKKHLWREINDILRLNGFCWLSNGNDSCWIKELKN